MEHGKKCGKIIEETLERYPSLLGFCADEGYRETCKEYVEDVLGKILEISKKIKNEWVVIPKRWIVERTFGWQNLYRRLSKD